MTEQRGTKEFKCIRNEWKNMWSECKNTFPLILKQEQYLVLTTELQEISSV